MERSTPATNDDQAELWNGPSGSAWVEMQDLLDRMFEPFERLLTEAAAGARSVLDVGCGTGSTTLTIARHLGQRARCTGLDISGPMLDLARDRARREGSTARFIRADAQVHAFEPAGFDRIVSRFGVMFFGDPVAAFSNLRHAASGDALLHCIVWRSAAENPFMTTSERAAAPLLPQLPARKPGAPGQFAFADSEQVAAILRDAGWVGIDIRPIDIECTLPERRLVEYLGRLGPVGQALRQVDASTRARVIETVRPAFEPYVHGSEVRFTAACWALHASP